MTARKKPEGLRSHRWFGVDSMHTFGRRSRTMEMGSKHAITYPRNDWSWGKI